MKIMKGYFITSRWHSMFGRSS